MQSTIWIIAAVAVVVLAVGVVRAALRSRHAFVPAVPATISVTEPVEDVLESPRHAAEARAAEARASRATEAHRRAS